MKKIIMVVTVCCALCLSGCFLREGTGNPNNDINTRPSQTAPVNTDTTPNDKTGNGSGTRFFTDDGTEVTYVPATTVEITAADDTEVRLIVSGKELTFDGQKPVVKDGEVFIPVLGVFEHLTGAHGNTEAPFTVKWDEAATTVTIQNKWVTVIITKGEQSFTYKGQSISPAEPPQTINGTFMLPLKAIAEAMDVSLEWDEAAGTVSIFHLSRVSFSN